MLPKNLRTNFLGFIHLIVNLSISILLDHYHSYKILQKTTHCSGVAK